jgi:protein-disulfide isomerase
MMRPLESLAVWAERHPKLILALAVVAGLAVTFVLQNRPPPAQTLGLTPVVEDVLDDRGTPRVGPADAQVVIVLFTDYRCPICRRTDPALERLIAKDPTVRVHFKDWPILGEQSTIGARVALAAEAQGKYLAMHSALMANSAPLTQDRIGEMARDVGLDPARLEADLARSGADIDRQLSRHAGQAFALGLHGTPAYLVGPYLIQGGMDDAALAKAVERARKAGPPKPRQPE